ncbi:1-(5-phosphoribosyl)-5-amino-4-imidazole-carboxylate (AIR) carboxylase PurE [Clostridium aceticum]|uniref:1-(5-phosphoribosyl)-5-amino-4-imidazole-carboxylate (AIR) carboxylase PurE n=1 Tax=Clostridium aceticum TaxID=84022 RepID=A0A0D8IE27_9CLOT|nr:nickel pincer cofactor biosynthesis protein LarB [Clostridium aceticum]AKL94050.1 1-(5-phosphoribosyl)-5-amino-4-imidazole-carboxylate (AIR) carboxylase PurE [Clostridium aceticum]KJF28580.1 1-(5-phosphoribosyl)-5-amino-4-imidazole-carboxylate carboxylase [Clostridium aceticum]
MRTENIEKLLLDVKENKVSVNEALSTLKQLPYQDLGFAKIDHHRELRQGYPEVIYCSGKTVEQVVDIVEVMFHKGSNILGTRATEEMYLAVKEKFPMAEYNKMARIITLLQKEIQVSDSYIVVATGGTSDIPIAEEAAMTAEILGNKVERVYDVGVAGIHRLFSKLDIIREAKVVIAVAGMEGALASVVGGLVDKPVIAVPTSIGYGANFGGLAALLSMLNSCSSGTAVVNIDNGFGAGYMASMINKL